MSKLKKTTEKQSEARSETRTEIRPEIRPTVKQDQAWKFWQDTHTEFLGFGGSAHGGKTWVGCEMLLVQAYVYPGSKSFVGRNELKRLMQSTFITWSKVCKHHGIPQEDWKLNGQYNYIEFKNGSRIDLLDLARQPSDPLYERFGSLEYTNGWIEEAGEVDFLAFDVLKSRIGRWKNAEFKLLGKMLLTFNPKKGWLYKTFYKPWKEGTLPQNIKFVQALPQDNPHGRDEAMRMLAQIEDRATRERLLLGNWDYDDDPTALIDYAALCDIWTNIVERSDVMSIVCDVARYGSDKIVIGVWKGLEVVHIEWHEKKGIDETATILRTLSQAYTVPWGAIVIDEDGIGGGLVDHMRGVKGFTANAAPLPNKLGVIPNFQHLKAQCSYLFAEYVNARKIKISTEDSQVKTWIEEEIQQLKSFDADKDGKKKILPKDKIKEVLGRSPDFLDMLVMRMLLELSSVSSTQPTTKFASGGSRDMLVTTKFAR